MAEIRLSKLMRQFNIGLDTLVEYLQTQGVTVPEDPNAKVEDSILPALSGHFGKDKEMVIAAEKVGVRISAILKETNEKKRVRLNSNKTRAKAVPSRANTEREEGTTIVQNEPKRKYPKHLLIKEIKRSGRIITEPFGKFNAGVLFPKDILFRGEPISIKCAEELIPLFFHVNEKIPCRIFDVSAEKNVAFLQCDLSEIHFQNNEDFELLVPGTIYSVMPIGRTPHYCIVSIVDTQLRGLVLNTQIDDGALFDSQGYIRLQLIEKPDNRYQLLRFVRPLSAPKRSSDEIINEVLPKFLTRQELDAISPEDLTIVQSMLSVFPDLIRKRADIVTGVELYAYTPNNSPLYFYIKQNAGYIPNHSFWISVNQEDAENPSIALFTESPTIVIELKALSDDVFTVSNFDAGRTNFTKNILQKYNKRTRLKIAGENLHFISKYEPVPSDYNTETVIDCFGKLYDFNSRIIPSIHEAIREKTLLSAKDYSILSSFLKFQRDKEIAKENEYIFITPNRIDTASGARIGDRFSIRFRLSGNEVETLIGESVEDTGALHVAIVNEDGVEQLTGVLDAEGDEFVLRFDRDHIDLTDYLTKGIRLQKRANVKHIQIQMNAIEDFVKRDSLKVYQDLINNRLETPDMEQAKGINFQNPLFLTSSGDNTQSDAVKKALGNKNVLLIQGPPGTGKTTIIVEIIEQLVMRGKKVLVCSQAHAAVKNIFDRLHERRPDLDLLALDDKDEVTAAARNFDDEAYTQFLKNNIAVFSSARRGASEKELDALINSFIYNTPERTKDFRRKHHHVIDYREAIEKIPPQNITFLLERLKGETRNLDTDLLKAQVYREKDVILGTCIGIGMDPVMRDKDAVHFDTVIVDEAGKANLAETIVPLQLGDRFILVGDHRQLPPYYDREEINDYREKVRNDARSQNFSQQEVETAMNKSLFSDFFDHEFFPADNKVTLNYQFRMNPVIGQYISDLFYAGKLYSGEGTEKQTVSVDGFADPVTFIDTYVRNITEENDPRETKSPDGSVYNVREIKVICEMVLPHVSDAIDANPDLTIGIITPYKAQVRKLRDALKETRFKESIYTIDSIQGSEFDIVVFSFVRAFPIRSNKKVGFLDDLRRLNVSLSRAKKKLILVGHLPTLQNPDAHVEAPIPGMVSPVEVFSTIASRVKRYGERSPFEKFMDLGFEPGHIFRDCEYHNDGQAFIIIHLEEFDFASRVAPKGFNGYDDGASVEVILSGYDATGRPQFDSTDLYKFLQTHKEGENYIGTVSRIYVKPDGGKTIYVTVDKYEDRLKLAPSLKDTHPEYEVVGTTLSVQIDHYKDDPERIFFRPYFSEAERVRAVDRGYTFFNATVKELQEFPMVIFRFKDESEITLPSPFLWHTAVENEYYDLIKFSNGDCELHTRYLDDFLKTHNKNVRYNGLIVSEDKEYYYVEVDEYCGVIEKTWAWRRGVKIDEEYPVEISGVNKYHKIVYFKFV